MDDIFTSSPSEDIYQFSSDPIQTEVTGILSDEIIEDQFEEYEGTGFLYSGDEGNYQWIGGEDGNHGNALFSSEPVFGDESGSISYIRRDDTGSGQEVTGGTENQRNYDSTKEEEIFLLREILNKIPNEKENEEETTIQETEEPSTEQTSDQYLYLLSNIEYRIGTIQETQKTQTKNNNLIGVTIIIILSAILASFFIYQLMGRIR